MRRTYFSNLFLEWDFICFRTLSATFWCCVNHTSFFDVLLTVHLSIFISVITQLDAQNFCFTISLFHASTCFEHMCSKHVEAWNKLIAKQKFCASSWLITEMKTIHHVSLHFFEPTINAHFLKLITFSLWRVLAFVCAILKEFFTVFATHQNETSSYWFPEYGTGNAEIRRTKEVISLQKCALINGQQKMTHSLPVADTVLVCGPV